MQLRQTAFCRTIGEALDATGLDAGRLELEITEGVLMENVEQQGGQLPAWAGGGRRAAGDRRFRHRLQLAGLPQAPAGDDDQDRPLVRARPRPRTRGTRRWCEAIVTLGKAWASAWWPRAWRTQTQLSAAARARLRQSPGLLHRPSATGGAIRASARRVSEAVSAGPCLTRSVPMITGAGKALRSGRPGPGAGAG